MKLIFTFFLVAATMGVFAQTPAFVWAQRMGGTQMQEAKSVAVDASGNVYTTGFFQGTTDFNPGAAVFNLTSIGGTANGDIFVSKLNAAGNFVWAKSMGGNSFEQAVGIAVDASGNVYTIGTFFATIDFNPGAAVFNMTPVGDNDIFISKLDANGNFVWAKQFGGTTNDYASSIAIDAGGNICFTGAFTGTADFDPGPGVFNLSSGTNSQLFVSKISSAGILVWAKQTTSGPGNNVVGSSIAIDPSGNIVTTGYFTGIIDFDPGAATVNLTNAGPDDVFIQKLDAAGNFVWAKSMGGTSVDEGYSIAVDATGNVYTTGAFYLTADFDPGPAIFNLTAGSAQDIFIVKLDVNGNFVWAKSFVGNSYDFPYRIAVDASGFVYTTGSFIGTTDFDPGIGKYKLISYGIKDVFISKLDPSGNFYWAVQMGGTSWETANDMALDAAGNIYTTGFLQGLGDYDPGPGGFNLTPVGNKDIFVSKLSQPVLLVPPTVTSFDPSSGYTGTSIQIAGSYFSNTTAVTIDTVNAMSFTVNNTISITAIVGAGNSGVVAVSNPNGTTSSAASFTYLGYISENDGHWNDGSTWLGGNVPPAGASVTINNNVTLNSNITVNPGNSLVVNSTLNLGTFTVTGAGIFTLSDYAFLSSSNSNGITGNINTTTINLSPNAGFIFNAASAMSTAGLPPIVSSLRVEMTGPGTVNLLNDLLIIDELRLTNGTITTGVNKIIIDNYGSITGSNSGSYVNGNLQRNIREGVATVNFPIGDATIYRPVVVDFNEAPEGVLLAYVSQSAADHPNIGISSLDPNRSVNRYWTLTDVNNSFTGSTYDAGFEFAASDLDALANPANLIVGKYSQGSWTYPATEQLDPLHIKATGITGFSNFAIAEMISSCAVTGTGTTTAVLCIGNANGTATITLAGLGAGAPGTYTVDGGGSLAYSTNPFTITGLSAGNHTIIATVTAGGCVSSAILVNVATPANFAATYIKTNLSSCNAGVPDGTITVTPAGGTAPYTYTWTGVTGSGNPASTVYPNPGNVSSLTGLNYGYYNATITDANNCAVITLNNIHVEFAYSVYVTASGSASSSCGNIGSVILYGNAGVQPYTYSINGTTYQAGNTFTGLPAATYTGYVKDAGGCVSTKTGIVIGSSAALTVTTFTRAAGSCANDGSIEVYRTGGVPPYTYSKDGTNYQVSNLFGALAAGPYTVYVKDGAGCVGSQPTTVAQGAALLVTANKTNTSTCINDGTIQVNASGGVAPYTYSKNAGTTFQAGNSFAGLGNTSYAIVVKDAKGCLGNLNVTINLNAIVVSASATNAASCAGIGSIQLFRTGGVGPYMYSLDGNIYQSSTIFSNKAPGTYTGYVKDSKACVGTLSGIVVGPNCIPGFTASNVPTGKMNRTGNNVLKVKAYPNPGATEFTLSLQGYDKNKKVSITVTDIAGRKVLQSEMNIAKQVSFGKELKAGIYVLKVVQGELNQVIKLVKE